jgi:hypothetical protein
VRGCGCVVVGACVVRAFLRACVSAFVYWCMRSFLTLIIQLCAYRDRISIFNPSLNAAEDMDKVILRSIMKVKV